MYSESLKENGTSKSSAKTCSRKSSLNEVAAAEIKSLLADGITPTPEEIVRLNDACREAECPTGISPAAIGRPTRLTEGRWLWPFTIAAGEWYEWACDTLPEDYHLAALCYSREHAREEGVFLTLYSLAEAKKALNEYSRGLNATLDEILLAVKEDVDAPEPQGDVDADGRENIVKLLIALCGGDPDYWLHRVSQRYAIAQMETAIQIAKAGGPNVTVEQAQAERAVGKVLIEIHKAHRGKPDE
jgi:hypothetical protein